MLAPGGFLTSMALLLLAACAITFRRPDAPRWTTRGWVHEVATIAFTALFVIGLGHLVAGGASAYREGPHPVDLGLFLAVVVGATMIWRRLDVRARLRAYNATAPAGTMRAPTIAAAPDASPIPAPRDVPTAQGEPPPRTPRDRAA